VYRKVRAIAQRRGEAVPSYSAVYDIVQKLPADLITLAHEGSKAYSDASELVHRREADRPNAVWQADHTPLDILLIRQEGTAAKPREPRDWAGLTEREPTLASCLVEFRPAFGGCVLRSMNSPRGALFDFLITAYYSEIFGVANRFNSAPIATVAADHCWKEFKSAVV
jgi:hypothetical protein